MFDDPEIDFVGIDNRLPLSDWRDGFDHLDAAEGGPAIDMTACQRDPCWASGSKTDRTARSRTSGENSFVVLLRTLHPAQALEPLANPVRSGEAARQ